MTLNAGNQYLGLNIVWMHYVFMLFPSDVVGLEQ